MLANVVANTEMKRDVFLRELVRIQYKRNDVDFQSGNVSRSRRCGRRIFLRPTKKSA